MLADTHDTERPGIEEAYTTATNTSDLKVRSERRGDVDIIIAAGWNEYRIGGALLRLHTEFDSAARLRLVTKEDLLGPGRHDKDERKAAGRAARAHNLTETSLLLQKLNALPDVRTQIMLRLLKWRVEGAEEVGLEVLQWWLAPSCEDCGGTKFRVADGTGRHTAKVCPTCLGLGTKELPRGQLGRKLANWMDQCVERARAGMARFMGSDHGRQSTVEMIRGCCAVILAEHPNDSAARKIFDRLAEPEKPMP